MASKCMPAVMLFAPILGKCQYDWCEGQRHVKQITTKTVPHFEECRKQCLLDYLECGAITFDGHTCTFYTDNSDGHVQTVQKVWTYTPGLSHDAALQKFPQDSFDWKDTATHVVESLEQCTGLFAQEDPLFKELFPEDPLPTVLVFQSQGDPVYFVRGEVLPKMVDIVFKYNPNGLMNTANMTQGNDEYLRMTAQGLDVVQAPKAFESWPAGTVWTWSDTGVFQNKGQSTSYCLSNYLDTQPAAMLGERPHSSDAATCCWGAYYGCENRPSSLQGGWCSNDFTKQCLMDGDCVNGPPTTSPVPPQTAGNAVVGTSTVQYQESACAVHQHSSGGGWEVLAGKKASSGKETTCMGPLTKVTLPTSSSPDTVYGAIQDFDAEVCNSHYWTIRLADGSDLPESSSQTGLSRNNGLQDIIGTCSPYHIQRHIPVSQEKPELLSSDQHCSGKFLGNWVDLGGNFKEWPRMIFSAEPLKNGNGRMNSVTPWGPVTWPANFYEEAGDCKVNLCFGDLCQGFAIGTVTNDQIQWDFHNSNDVWIRQTHGDACFRGDVPFSCCREDKLLCGLAPNKERCNDLGGDFCCNPMQPDIFCGQDPTEHEQQVMI